MTKQEKIETIKRVSPDEIPVFMQALRILKSIDGISISGDDEKLKEIEQVLDFTPATPEGRGLKRGMIEKATAKAQEGLLGNGTFLID